MFVFLSTSKILDLLRLESQFVNVIYQMFTAVSIGITVHGIVNFSICFRFDRARVIFPMCQLNHCQLAWSNEAVNINRSQFSVKLTRV